MVKDNAFKQGLIFPAIHEADNAWGIPLNGLPFCPALQDVCMTASSKFCLNKLEDDTEDIHFSICGQMNVFFGYLTALF